MKGNHVCFSLLCFALLFSLHISSSSSSSKQHHCAHGDAFVLLEFKKLFNSDRSASFMCRQSGYSVKEKTLSWNESSDCCKWEGVTCDRSTGHVIGLDLSCSGLQGHINPNSSLFQLHHLRKLNLAFNNFSYSPLPNEIGSLTSLTHLNLSASPLSGTTLSGISHLSKLISLDLSYSFFDSDSTFLFLQNLTKLEVLSLSTAMIRGSIPRNISTSLRHLDLGWNSVVGFIPDSIFQLPKLQSLSLQHNGNLVGSLPKFSWNCNRTLQWLDLSLTGISGVLPNSIGNLRSLNYFLLYESGFSGSIPESIGNLTSLEVLDFSFNEFSGSVPFTISNLNQLTALELPGNHFEGEIPDVFSNLQEVTVLALHGNNFTGFFPSSIVNMTRLEDLLLTENSLVGSLPSVARRLRKLQSLHLSRNALSGIIPPWIFSISSLIQLDLSQNKFMGQLPEKMSKSLELVILSDNQLNGSIPYSISELVHASALNFASNNFSGEVATEIFLNMKNLLMLDLHSNKLQGPLPITFCNLSALQILNLQYNKFDGMIPQCLGELEQLSVLDLRMNNFNGIAPTMFAKGNILTTISLNGNQLQGPIPRSLVNCRELQVLDLGNNKLNDTFPKWLGDLPELQVLILRSNRFYGPITSSQFKVRFPKLRIFDLSSNGFIGAIPKYFFNDFKGMVNENQDEDYYLEIRPDGKFYLSPYDISINLVIKGHEIHLEKVMTIFTTIDLSSNHIEGEIPIVVGNLNSLRLLNLSHNCLNGSIPHRLVNLKLLESLDISWNQLTGKIPEELTSLTFLEVLNLSRNHLIGHIPRGNQFNTFGSNSYGGNLNLCGFPLSNECNDSNKPLLPQQQHVEPEDKSNFLSGFTWRVVVIGFGCGVVFGIFMENLMSQVGKPKWFVTFYGGKIRKTVQRPTRNGRRH